MNIFLKFMFSCFLSLAASSAFAQGSGASCSTILPAPLQKGARIALVTPSTCIDSGIVTRAKEKIAQLGYVPVEMSHVYGHANGSYTASDSARAADIMRAFTDSQIDAILCTRGGYGSTHLLPLLDVEAIRANPKWLIGFSDITALHAFMSTQAGVASIHGPMCRHIDKHDLDDQSLGYLLQMIEQGPSAVEYNLEPNAYNKPGKAKGRIVGGNLLVASGLAGTPYDVFNPAEADSAIYFIEDVGEKIYAIERFLLRLHLSGVLTKAQGLILGQFTEYGPDSNFETMEQMIHERLRQWGYYDNGRSMPILFYFPAGHGEPNYPLPLGQEALLEVTPEGSHIQFF